MGNLSGRTRPLLVGRSGAVEEEELKPADLQFVTIGQWFIFNKFLIDVGAIERTNIFRSVRSVDIGDLDVAA